MEGGVGREGRKERILNRERERRYTGRGRGKKEGRIESVMRVKGREEGRECEGKEEVVIMDGVRWSGKERDRI